MGTCLILSFTIATKPLPSEKGSSKAKAVTVAEVCIPEVYLFDLRCGWWYLGKVLLRRRC